MTSSLKKTKVRLDVLTNINMLLMIEKGISGGICHSIHQYAKANNKYMKKKSSCIKYCDITNLYGWEMPSKLRFSVFKWVEETSKFNQDCHKKL